jgi:hypothetical protein
MMAGADCTNLARPLRKSLPGAPHIRVFCECVGVRTAPLFNVPPGRPTFRAFRKGATPHPVPLGILQTLPPTRPEIQPDRLTSCSIIVVSYSPARPQPKSILSSLKSRLCAK